MKQMSLTLNLKGITGDVDQFTPEQWTEKLIDQLIASYATQNRGLNYEEQRKAHRLTMTIEDAIEKGERQVNLEDAWFDFLKKIKIETKMNYSKMVTYLYDLIEEAELRRVDWEG
jgi:hypothetical protein